MPSPIAPSQMLTTKPYILTLNQLDEESMQKAKEAPTVISEIANREFNVEEEEVVLERPASFFRLHEETKEGRFLGPLFC